MSANMPPNASGQPSNHGHTGHADGSNPYSNRYHQPVLPDLDASAPHLRSGDLRRMNRRALFFLAAMAALVLCAALWVVNLASQRNETKPKVREEQLTVTPPPPSMPVMPERPTRQKAAPIPLASAPSLPAPRVTPPPMSGDALRKPTLVQRRIAANDVVDANASNPMQASVQPQISDATSAQPLIHPDTLMLRGTYIRCVLETRIVTDIPGFTSCVVTEPVYSFTGHKLLLPKGSKVLGKYDTVPNGPRVAVIWDRIVTPTGIDVNMASPGVDNLGGAGHPGYFNAHWGSRISSALLISLLSDAFKYEAAVHGPTQTTISNGVVTQTPFESNTAQTVQELANQAVRRSANMPPTVTINQGAVINIYVAKDVDFSGVVARF